MSIAKRIVSLLLILVLCFSLVGCKKSSGKKQQIVVIKRPSSNVSDTVEDNSSGDDYLDGSNNNSNGDNGFGGDLEDGYISDRLLAEVESNANDKIEPEYVTKVADFKLTDEYTVIYPDGNTQLNQAAQKLVKYLAKNGINVTLASDATSKKDLEILIGDTNRKKSKLSETKYAVSIYGKNLVFESGNFNGVVKAVSWFIAMPYTKDKVNTLVGEYKFSSTLKRPDGTYTFVWGDEFDGNALDASKWELTTHMSAGSSFKLSRDPEAISVSDGLLKLSAKRWFDPENNQVQAIAPYTVEGKRHVNFQYGYLEMRARIPFSSGAWPSLWLSGACGTNSGAVVSNIFDNGDIIPSNFSAEFDIIEYTTLQPNLHKWFYDEVPGITDKHSSLGAVEKPVKSDLGLDVTQSYVYQIIAFDWTPEKLTIYINGEEFYSYDWKNSVQLDELNDMSDFLNPVFIRLNNHLIPENIPSDFSTLPCEYYVDYLRLYQKSGTGGIWLAD